MAGRWFNSIVQWVSRIGIFISSIVLGALMCLVAVDVILRYCFNSPFAWSYEITELLLVFIVFLGLLHVQTMKGHVKVDILVSRLPSKPRYVVEIIVAIVSFILVFLMAWQAFETVKTQLVSKLSTGILLIPIYPFVVVAGCGLVLLCIGFLKDIIDSVAKRR